MPAEEVTLAERLKAAGYATGQVGKWHLEPGAVSRAWARKNLPGVRPDREGRFPIPIERALEYYPHRQGFDEFFVGVTRRYYANYDLARGDQLSEAMWVDDARYRLDVQSDAAVAFLDRPRDEPFFLYVAYFAPHVPLEATDEYLARFPGPMAERRRYALAMISAVDDGVGRILDSLERKGLADETLVVFASDNGAPLLGKKDLPIAESGATWDGSVNDPWIGEKGMLAEGGIRVPFLLRWPAKLPAGKVYDRPVSTLDIAATAVAAAGLPDDKALDGVDLVPFLTGAKEGDPHEALYWRFWGQAAIRSGNWKYLSAGENGEYLFDLGSEAHEKKNLIAENLEVAGRLHRKLAAWEAELQPPGPPATSRPSEKDWYSTHFGSVQTGR
jgi:arylsulfatase A-like enzyme